MLRRVHDEEPARERSGIGERLFGGGVAGNARLTAWDGLALLVLLFFEGMTLPFVRRLLVPHAFIGFLLVPPLALKLGSTGYRFVRYYSGNRRYREAGPPAWPLRFLAPVLVLTIVAVIASGAMLLLVGPGDGPWRSIHVLAFLLWFCVMTVHVLAYTSRAVRLAWRDRRNWGGEALAGAVTRHSLLLGSIVLGVAVAVALLPLDSSWLHAVRFLGGDH